ncbi:MAG: hypothetical protein AAF640_10890 [Pseudomonadota bacterium]
MISQLFVAGDGWRPINEDAEEVEGKPADFERLFIAKDGPRRGIYMQIVDLKAWLSKVGVGAHGLFEKALISEYVGNGFECNALKWTSERIPTLEGRSDFER